MLDFAEPAELSKYSDRWQANGRFYSRQGQEISLHSIQTGSGTHPASYPIGTGGSFPEGKMAGA
jgi:hypothetical protein